MHDVRDCTQISDDISELAEFMRTNLLYGYLLLCTHLLCVVISLFAYAGTDVLIQEYILLNYTL